MAVKSSLETMPKKPPVLKIDPGTVVLIGSVLVLLPLLLTGFMSQ